MILSWPPQVSCGLHSISLFADASDLTFHSHIKALGRYRSVRPVALPILEEPLYAPAFALSNSLWWQLAKRRGIPNTTLCRASSSNCLRPFPGLLAASLSGSTIKSIDQGFENHPMADWNLILGRTRSAGGTSPGWTQLAEAECWPAINRKEDISPRLGQPLLVCAGAWFARTWVDMA